MDSNDLKKLSRRELVEVIYQMKRDEQRLQEEIAALQKALQDKRIRLAQAGSVAEAAVSVTELLSAAQNTADLYLQEITLRKEQAEKECAKMIEDANRAVARILADGKKQYAALRVRYQSDQKKWRSLQAQIQEQEALSQKILEELFDDEEY